MEHTIVSRILTKKTLNDKTGELEETDFKEIKEKKQIKGGFRMVYKDYDTVLLSIVKSGKDLELLLFIRDLFTYNKIEIYIQSTEISKSFKVAKSKVSMIIKAMVDNKLLMRVDRGVYRLNPFMYLPYRSEAEVLQREWKFIEEKQKSQS
jgi:hypothetical protein